jgi:hemerythrin-like metal-binding protein
VAQHFHDEEALLGQVGYEGLDHHAKLHAKLMAEAEHLQDEVNTGSLDTGRLLAYLALDLVKGHILTEDQNYFLHFKN